MNGWHVIIIGLVLVAIGGFLGFYGSALATRADNDAASRVLNTKIGEVLTKLEVAEQNAPTSSSALSSSPEASAHPAESGAADKKRQIATITENFRIWATEFLNNSAAKKVELNKVREAKKNEEKRISANCRPVFQFAVNLLRGSVEAYDAAAGAKYKANLIDLPQNLYEITGSTVDIGTILFSDEIHWKIEITVYKPSRADSPPVFYINIPNSKTNEPQANFRIEVRPTNLLLQAGGGGIAGMANWDGIVPNPGYEDALRRALERLLETQITSLSPH